MKKDVVDSESEHKVQLRQDEKAVNIDLNHLLASFGIINP